MLNQFSRTELLYGKEAMERLTNARVAIFGLGGVGGYTAEALARSGVGTFDLIDDDKVCLTVFWRSIRLPGSICITAFICRTSVILLILRHALTW